MNEHILISINNHRDYCFSTCARMIYIQLSVRYVLKNILTVLYEVHICEQNAATYREKSYRLVILMLLTP